MIHNWLVVSNPLKNTKVSWDDDIPNIWEVIKVMFQTTNQLWYHTWHITYIEPPAKAIQGTPRKQCPARRHLAAMPGFGGLAARRKSWEEGRINQQNQQKWWFLPGKMVVKSGKTVVNQQDGWLISKNGGFAGSWRMEIQANGIQPWQMDDSMINITIWVISESNLTVPKKGIQRSGDLLIGVCSFHPLPQQSQNPQLIKVKKHRTALLPVREVAMIRAMENGEFEYPNHGLSPNDSVMYQVCLGWCLKCRSKSNSFWRNATIWHLERKRAQVKILCSTGNEGSTASFFPGWNWNSTRRYTERIQKLTRPPAWG